MTDGSTFLVLDASTATATVRGQAVALTRKEYLALALLHGKAGGLCTRDELALQVWPEVGGVTSNDSIEQVISHLRRKLEVDARNPRHLLTVRGMGYRLVPDQPSVRSGAGTHPRTRLRQVFALVAVVGVLGVLATLFWLRMSVSSQPASTRAEPALRYADDFADASKTFFPLGGSTSQVGVASDSSVANGEYRVRLLKAPPGAGLHAAGLDWLDTGNFALEVEARAEDAEDILAYGLLLNQDNVGGLRLQVAPGRGSFRVFALKNGSAYSLADELTTAVRRATAGNHLRLEVRGDELSVLINGQLVHNLTDPSLRQRPVRLQVGVWPIGEPVDEDDNAVAVFDNFRVYALAD